MFPYSILAQIPTAVVDSLETVEQEKAAAWRSLPLDEAVDKFVSGLIELAINILIAAIVFYVGKFIIKKEEASSAGVRRIKAVLLHD